MIENYIDYGNVILILQRELSRKFMQMKSYESLTRE